MLSGNMWLAIGVLAGGLLLVRMWRAAEGRVVRLEADKEALTSRSEQLAANLSREAQARKRQAEELVSLRNKADKVKRRQGKTSDQPLGTTARIRDFEAQLDRVALERDRAKSEGEALAQEVARLQARLDASAHALEKASAPAPKPAATESENALERVQAELSASREQVAKLNEEVGDLRQTEARLRKRMDNQEKLYASLRAELDVKKDRLRTQEEQLQRLQALKVAVLD